jgi:uncharacterized protein (TIGR02246 family)
MMMRRNGLLVAPAVVGALFLALAGCASMGAGNQEVFAAAMKEVGDRYCAAMNDGDAAAYLANWDDEGIQMPPNAPMVVGKAAIAAKMPNVYKAMDFKGFAIKPVESVQVGDLGYLLCTYSYSVTPTAGGATTTFDGKSLSIYRKQADGSWKVYRDCFNSNTPVQ